MYCYDYFVNLRTEYIMKKLSSAEEEAMQAVWKTGRGFIKDFMDSMEGPKPPYTTLASTLKSLERKGFLKSEKLGNAYRYSTKINESEYKKRFVSSFVSDYFKNSYKDLVAFFANEKKISPQELKEVIDLIEKSKS